MILESNPVETTGDIFVTENKKTQNTQLYVTKILAPKGPGTPNNDTPIVLLHGLLGSSRNFNSWARALSTSLPVPRDIYLMDLRNHGQSAHVEGMGYLSMAEDVLMTMQDQGLKNAFFIGHSMGGKVTSTLALMHPDKVSGAVIMDIAPVPYSAFDGTNWAESQKLINALGTIDLEEMETKSDVDNFLARDVVNPALRAFALTNLAQDPKTNKLSWKINLDTIIKNLATVAEYDIGQGRTNKASTLGISYEGNVLFLGGSNSRYIRSVHLKEISKLFPVFLFQNIEGAGHWIHAEKPQETINAINLYFKYIQNN